MYVLINDNGELLIINYLSMNQLTLNEGVVRTSKGISLNEVRVMNTQQQKMTRTRLNTALT